MIDPLHKLEPPPGGLDRFRARLVREPDRRARPVWIVVPALAVAAAALWLVPMPRLQSPVPEPVAAVGGSLVKRLDSSNPRVILYAVAPTEGLVSAP